jgi:2-oxoglutarate dehydrogenase E2 component (dihydrolipoamide succinyltransferase)
MGTPIIVQPQVGILAIGTIKKMAAVVETKTGDEIQIRNKLFLSHTYDHRIIDGALGGKFAQKVAENLENFDLKSNISK